MSSKIIRYYRDCYEEDHRRSGIWNVFKEKADHRIFVEDREEVLTGDLSRLPIDPEEGKKLRQDTQLYLREKELLYASLFVVGRFASEDDEGVIKRPRMVCAPLLLFPARLIEDAPFLFVEPDLTDLRLNAEVLGRLCGIEDGPDLAEAIWQIIEPGNLRFDEVAEIKDLVERFIPHVQAPTLLDYPALLSEHGLRQVLKKAKQQDGLLQIVSASSVLLVSRSRATRGVLSELESMAEAETTSPPVAVLLGQQVASAVSASSSGGHVPAILSASQERILHVATRHPASVVIGPPGTGKSYTIAALAVEHISRGETVLVASKMNHAVDVIGDKIERQLGIKGCVVRGGRRTYLRELKAYLRQLLSGLHTTDAMPTHRVRQEVRDLRRLERDIASMEERLGVRMEQERAWGRLLAHSSAGVLNRMRVRWLRWRAQRTEPLWVSMNRLDEALRNRIGHTRDYIGMYRRRRLADILQTHRKALVTFSKAIRARTSGRQDALFSEIDFKILLKAFPVWLVNMADVSEVLPLRDGLFDLAIIDEATQCDVASCLPILQRARRAVIVGDPEQLRHISFLSRSRQQVLADKHGMDQEEARFYDYRTHSILDLFDERMDTQEQVVFLNEHYRSVPKIIGFSNEHFYGNTLRLMTARPSLAQPPGIILRQCEGRRDAQGVNVEEADRLLEDILALVSAEAGRSPVASSSIGVLSPFRSQVDGLAERLGEILPSETVEKHRVMVGTAHTFQGEERDVMFLSLVIDEDTHTAALRFLERPDVFNVAVTRARTKQYIYLSVDSSTLSHGSLLQAYLGYINRQAEYGVGEELSTVKDAFAREVVAALEDSMETYLAFPVAGMEMDIVVQKDGQRCGIDLVGYPGPFEESFSLERYRMFMRGGLAVVPVSYVRWCLDPAACVRAIKQVLQ